MGGNTSSGIEPSEVFGPYLVYERLGVGGMATVHRAKKRGIEGFERVCALKRMLPHLAEDAEFVKSFVREAKLAAMLQHANTVQIFELGRVGRVYFMAMEHIDGYDIRKVLRQARRRNTRPPVGVVLSILGGLCDALDYAHNRTDDSTGEPLGIVHRDVSPSNLLLTPAGHLKVIDFGIAKATSRALKTDTNRVKGKLGYMSPEAIQGKALDARSDIFSAGIIAHELLAVRPLFASRNDYETLTKIQRGEVIPPSSYNRDVPIELDDLVLKALAKAPHERFHSAAEMREALQRVALLHKLPASSRTTADWIKWAFEHTDEPFAPRATGAMAAWKAPTTDAIPTGESPLPHAEEDDEIIEIAWGGREDLAAGPVVVPGVPDVSDQIPGPMYASADDMESEDQPTDVVMEPIKPSQRRIRRRSLVDIPVADVLTPKITFRTPTGQMQAAAEFGQVTPTPRPVAVIPSDTTKIAAMPPVPKPKAPPAWARGTMPPKFDRVAAKDKAKDKARRRAPMGTGSDGVLRDAPDAAKQRRGSGFTTAQMPAAPAGDTRAQRIKLAAAIGAGFGLVVAVTAFIVSQGERARTPPAATARPAAAASASASAKLLVRSTPPGLGLVVDGQPVAEVTPTTLEVPAGSHRIALAKDGVELWSTTLQTSAGTKYELHPVLETPRPTVPWSDIVKTSGKRIRLGHVLRATAHVCITERGKVASVDVPNADARDVARIRKTVRKWRFKPYLLAGQPTPACFDMPIVAE